MDKNTTRKGRVFALMILFILFFATTNGSAQTVANEVGAVDPATGDRIRSIQGLVEMKPHSAHQLALPLDPLGTLIDRINRLSADVGFDQDATERVLASGLTLDLAGRLSNVLIRQQWCLDATQAHFDRLGGQDGPWKDIITTGNGLAQPDFQDLRDCADKLAKALLDLELALATSLTPSPKPEDCTPLGAMGLDVWPVIFFDGTCRNSRHLNDYMLLVDVGGHDKYVNNVGGNMVDLNFAPDSSQVMGVRGFGPSEGCDRAIPGLAEADCTPTVGVLLDMQGEDQFGVKQTPVHDAGCTDDLLVRRLVTVASGFLGVSFLLDVDHHNDHYTGKTGSIGSGHIFGVGVLVDRGGNDVYSAIRNSQGFALVGGVGVLRDEGGNDAYDYYMPRPLDPSAANQEEGAGGARDDEGDGLCDRIPRFMQGAANVLPGTIGILVDESGSDSYRAPFVERFLAPVNQSAAAGSWGFGANEGAAGVFLDRGGSDTYLADPQELAGVGATAGRGDGTTQAGASPVCDGSTPTCYSATGSNAGAGVFIDRA